MKFPEVDFSRYSKDIIEYFIASISEQDEHYGLILSFFYNFYNKKDYREAKVSLFKLMRKEKRNMQLRFYYIQLLILGKEYRRAIKWCQKYLPYFDRQRKATVLYFLGWLFYQTGRPERSIQYINYCLQLEKDFTPAKQLKEKLLSLYDSGEKTF